MSPSNSRMSPLSDAGSGRVVEVRFIRQTKSLSVPFPGTIEGLVENFLNAYKQRYGAEALPEKAGFEFVTYVVEAVGLLPRPDSVQYPSSGADARHAWHGRASGL